MCFSSPFTWKCSPCVGYRRRDYCLGFFFPCLSTGLKLLPVLFISSYGCLWFTYLHKLPAPWLNSDDNGLNSINSVLSALGTNLLFTEQEVSPTSGHGTFYVLFWEMHADTCCALQGIASYTLTRFKLTFEVCEPGLRMCPCFNTSWLVQPVAAHILCQTATHGQMPAG